MEAVRIVQGTAVPLDRSDVDTDQIIPTEWLKRVERTGFGKGLFSSWRDDRDFVLNDERFAGATILVAGPNFGTGSSPRARRVGDHGLRLPGRDLAPLRRHLPQQLHQERPRAGAWSPPRSASSCSPAVEADPTLELVVDVDRRTLVGAGHRPRGRAFPLDDSVRERFLEGLDDIGITLRTEDAITAFEATRPAWLPTACSSGEVGQLRGVEPGVEQGVELAGR